MNRTILIILLASVLLLGVYFILRDTPKTDDLVQNEDVLVPQNEETFTNPEIELAFTYPTGDEGYVLKERTHTEDPSGLVRTIILEESEDANTTPPVGGEGQATITIAVFENTDNQFPLLWAQSHMQYSNINLIMGETQETVVGGANAIRYMADGLYPTDTAVIAHGGYVYVITGMYADGETGIKSDFNTILRSITFIPPASPQGGAQGKLDINAVCEGARAYMTFTNEQSANKFVAECKEGLHPEVIEQYKTQLDLGADVAI